MNIQKMLKQAQKMQEDLARAQEELANRTVEASAGGGKVVVTASGVGDILSIKISPDVVNADDVELLEDLVLGGVKQAQAQCKQLAQDQMGRVAGGAGLPPGFGL